MPLTLELLIQALRDTTLIMNSSRIAYYRWSIPEELQETFVQQWTELTIANKTRYGLISARLFRSGSTEFVSLTQWPDEQSWKTWKEQDAGHPYRTKWRPYRTAGPEWLEPAIDV